MLFPYSVYEIKDIQEQEDYYKIYLNYIGKYKEKINQSKIFCSHKDFMKEIKEIDLVFNLANSICRLGVKKKDYFLRASGFCCLIPLPKKKIPVLITSYHAFNMCDIENNTMIQAEYMDRFTSFKINKSNKIYYNEFYDLAIIEIAENNDMYEHMYFLDVDEDLQRFKRNEKHISKEMDMHSSI